MKRTRDEDDSDRRPFKLRRVGNEDRLSKLSDELLVRILSFSSVRTLLTCQRISKRFDRISVDSELWKAAYYNQFVLPRASRIPGIKDAAVSNHLLYSSKLSKWLDDEHLVKKGPKTNWKQQYRLRYNWSQGQCAVTEILVAERPPDPPLLVLMQDGLIFTADSMSGLRVWSSKNDRGLIASTAMRKDGTQSPQLPTSMAIDTHEGIKHHRVAVGFADGSFTIYALERDTGSFLALFNHAPSNNGMLSALAYASPYLLTMSGDQLLSIYSFLEATQPSSPLDPPRLLYSLRSHTVWPPVSLSIRTTLAGMTAAIAYSIPTYLSGWTVGIQEMRLTSEGELIGSRLATAADENFQTLSGHRSGSSPSIPRSPSTSSGSLRERLLLSIPSHSKPTSMSYSHPYLLVAHPDNTLSSYLVKSTSSLLKISPGNRLWGHTSSVSGAHVGMRGKAVSVSRLGDELRVWDLEGGTAALAKRRTMNRELSVRVQPMKPGEEDLPDLPDAESRRRFGLRLALEQGFDDSTVSRGWVGFDEQHVIVLRENVHQGSQALVLYDFT